jgi:hypothetical protein
MVLYGLNGTLAISLYTVYHQFTPLSRYPILYPNQCKVIARVGCIRGLYKVGDNRTPAFLKCFDPFYPLLFEEFEVLHRFMDREIDGTGAKGVLRRKDAVQKGNQKRRGEWRLIWV